MRDPIAMPGTLGTFRAILQPSYVIQEQSFAAGTGTGSEIRQPLGYAIVGGLLVSQVLPLFTTAPLSFCHADARVSTNGE